MSQALLFAVMLSACGICLDGLAEENEAWRAKQFKFEYEESLHANSLYDKLMQFCSEFPCDIDLIYMWTGHTKAQRENDEEEYVTYPDTLFFYPNYQRFQAHLERLSLPTNLVTEQQFNEHAKVAILGEIYSTTSEGNFKQYKFSDENHIIIEGEEYLVLGSYSIGVLIIPCWESDFPETLMTKSIEIETSNIPSESQIKEIENLAEKTLAIEGMEFHTTMPEYRNLLDIRYSISNIIISFLLMVLTMFSIILIYNQMVLCRKGEFAVFSFCGFKKSVCTEYCIAELLVISFLSSSAGCFLFNGAIKPILNERYASVSTMFTFGYYAALVFGFMLVSVLMFLAFIAPTLKKNVIQQLHSI